MCFFKNKLLRNMTTISLWINLFTIIIPASAELYTSMENMELLLETDINFSRFVNLYLEKEEERLQKMKTFFTDFLQSGFQGNKYEDILSNPLEIFHFIKHLTVELEPLIKLMNSTVMEELITATFKNNKTVILPDKEDLNGVSLGINRLMNIYNINVSDMALGNVTPGGKSLQEMSAWDCSEIGLQLFLIKKYSQSIPWFKEAVDRESNERVKTINKEFILEYYAVSLEKIGEYGHALVIAKEFSDRAPKNTKAKQYVKHLEDLISFEEEKEKIRNIQKLKKINIFSKSKNAVDLYGSLCRNEPFKVQNHSKLAELKCYYSKNSPYLKIQPVKLEEGHHNPWVAIFHDIISAKEIDVIKNLTAFKLKRAGVGQWVKNSTTRISKNCWLTDEMHPVVARISRRLQEITGLDVMNGSESLQANNYGIGGHYEPHYDFSQDMDDNSPFKGLGNRLATFLIYLSNVKAGGGTVFPNLEFAINPEKGSVVFWYNLLKTGDGDKLTLHGACPVLSGNKWVCNKWIRSNPQMFRKPCGKTELDMYY